MQQRRPQTAVDLLEPAEQARRAELSQREIKRSQGDEPLTQIVLMYGICAYRKGGWEDPESTIKKRKYEKEEYEQQGVRTRLLTQGWVYCRWGRARKMAGGKADDGGEKVHGEAWNGGFKEFTDVEGVPQWLEMEKKERKKVARERAARKTVRDV